MSAFTDAHTHTIKTQAMITLNATEKARAFLSRVDESDIYSYSHKYQLRLKDVMIGERQQRIIRGNQLTLMLAQLFLMEMTRMMFVASSASGSFEYLFAKTRQASAISRPTLARSRVTITEP